MSKVVERINNQWCKSLLSEDDSLTETEREAIIQWLLGEDQERFETMTPEKLAIVEQGMDYRYRILRQRYFRVNATKAYQNLINRLGSVMMVRNKIQVWVSLSRDRCRAVSDVLLEVIQEMLNSDNYIQGQISWISQFSLDERLRNSLLLATLEEYCLRPIRNQPLLVYRFVNYLQRSSKGGMTQVPQAEIIRLVSDEIMSEDGESGFSFLDSSALTAYQDQKYWEEQQTLREEVKKEFASYLEEKLGIEAKRWLILFLQGRSQEAIAQTLGIPIKQVYRLREKINYHALQVFGLKIRPELIQQWLGIKLDEHNFGLTASQWESFWQELTTREQKIVTLFKEGLSLEAIAEHLNSKKTQVTKEWLDIYLLAQRKRNQSKLTVNSEKSSTINRV